MLTFIFALQNSVCEIAIKGGIDYNKTYKGQPMAKMGKIFAMVSDMLK